MPAKKTKLTPIEREINTRRRRVENGRKRIAEIQCNAINQVHEIQSKVDCDQAVLQALLKSNKTDPRK